MTAALVHEDVTAEQRLTPEEFGAEYKKVRARRKAEREAAEALRKAKAEAEMARRKLDEPRREAQRAVDMARYKAHRAAAEELRVAQVEARDLEARRRFAALVPMPAAAPPADGSWLPTAAPQAPAGTSSWLPVDFEDVLDGSYAPPVPGVVHRSDGVGLAYPGQICAVVGESESGKSWFVQYAAAEVLRSGGSVAYVDFEASAGEVVSRMHRDLQVPAGVLRARFRYIRPDVGAIGRTGTLHPDFRALIDAERDLVVFDGVNMGLGVEQLSLLDNDDVGRWYSKLLMPIAAAGAAVLTVDHVVKNGDHGGFAVGAQGKKSYAGSSLVVERKQPFGKGRRGVAEVRVAKDRPGGLRGHGGEARGDGTQLAAVFVLDSTGPDMVLELQAPGTAASVDRGTPQDLLWNPFDPQPIGDVFADAVLGTIKGEGRAAVRDLASWMCSETEIDGGAGRRRTEAIAALAPTHSKTAVRRAWDLLLAGGGLAAVGSVNETGPHRWLGRIDTMPEAWK